MAIRTANTSLIHSMTNTPVNWKSSRIVPTSDGPVQGMVVWNSDLCKGCMLCVDDCPSNALKLIPFQQPQQRYIMVYHLGRCVYCRQCAISCPEGSITTTMMPSELASVSKDQLEIFYGHKEDVDFFLQESE